MKSWQELKGTDNIGLVIGNGPSLNEIPIEFLKKYPSFGTNKIFLLDGFTPTYYVSVDPVAIDPFIDDIAKMDCKKFLRASYVKNLLADAFPLHSSTIPAFSRHPDQWVYEGHTVTFVCLQLAFFMGFKTVVLVGVDHNYQDDESANYFHSDYTKDVEGWHKPDMMQAELAYNMAKTVYEWEGRRIVNLTPFTALDVFEKGDIAEW